MAEIVEDLRERRDAIVALATPFVVAAILMAFFGNAVQRFADPNWLIFGGSCLATGVFAFLLTFLVDDSKHGTRWLLGSVAIGFIGLMIIAAEMQDALKRSQRLDHQCGLLEADMQSANPVRADGRELYSAMGCRYQATGTLTFKRRHK